MVSFCKGGHVNIKDLKERLKHSVGSADTEEYVFGWQEKVFSKVSTQRNILVKGKISVDLEWNPSCSKFAIRHVPLFPTPLMYPLHAYWFMHHYAVDVTCTVISSY